MTFNIHLHLVQWLGISGAIPPSPLYTPMKWTGTISHLPFFTLLYLFVSFPSLFLIYLFIYFYLFIYLFGGLDSVVGVATRYGLDGPCIEPQSGRKFP